MRDRFPALDTRPELDADIMQHPLALVCSVELEAHALEAALTDAHRVEVGRRPGTRGRLGSVPVLVLPVGMGKTNAAQGLTALLERHAVRGVIGFGVGGAYPGSGLHVGDLALATREIYGDEGVHTREGWISTREIGIPLLQRGEACAFNEFPLQPERVEGARSVLAGRGWKVAAGPFVTVSCCSGTGQRGAELAERFGAICESMEGAAYAHVAAHYEVPLLEVRGISNLVEDRDLTRWRLRDAAAAACEAVALLAAHWPDP